LLVNSLSPTLASSINEYCVGQAVLETDAPKFSFMNSTIFVGSGRFGLEANDTRAVYDPVKQGITFRIAHDSDL